MEMEVSFGFFTFTLGRMRSRRLFRTFVKYYLVGVVVLVLDISEVKLRKDLCV